ncbi:hypothetical protein DFH06DRAFT_1169507 [Mycena polygramma]|nr:hypothetical protein DFH06DRAFT_1169507 [Mycena polygramma]
MPASHQKDRFTVIGIRTAPPGLSKKDFKAKTNAVMNSLVALPVVQQNFLSFNVFFQNGALDAAMRDLGYPETPTSVMIITEYETVNHFEEYIQDPTVNKLLSEAASFSYHTGACAFSADAVVKVERGLSSTERRVWVGIFKGARDVPPADFQEKLNTLTDRLMALPSYQRNVVKCTMFLQNDVNIASHMNVLGFPAAEPTFVIVVEAQTQEGLMEICTDAEMAQLVGDAMKDFAFHVDSICGGMEVVAKI